MCGWQSTNQPGYSFWFICNLLFVFIILKRLFHVKMLFPITWPRPLCDAIFCTWFGKKWKWGNKFRGREICLVYAYFSSMWAWICLLQKNECNILNPMPWCVLKFEDLGVRTVYRYSWWCQRLIGVSWLGNAILRLPLFRCFGDYIFCFFYVRHTYNFALFWLYGSTVYSQ